MGRFLELTAAALSALMVCGGIVWQALDEPAQATALWAIAAAMIGLAVWVKLHDQL